MCARAQKTARSTETRPTFARGFFILKFFALLLIYLSGLSRVASASHSRSLYFSRVYEVLGFSLCFQTG